MNILDIIFPHPCIYCGKFKDTDEFGFCAECMESLPMKLNKRVNTFYLFEYDKRISTLLKISKYAGRPYYVRMLASLMGKLMAENKTSYDLTAFVPMHKRSFSIRGYNQSQIAAEAIARKLRIPVCSKCLKKVKKNKKQAGLGKAERRYNVKDVYKSSATYVKGKRILLVDDIMTTGSTLNECEKELRYAGAANVERAVVAYTPVGRNR
ncbi:MAG: ComF family protein [Clostridia bacterium]|nr:ComF family protein [Clostridia bacterium]